MFTKNFVLETVNRFHGSHRLDLKAKNTYKWVMLLPESAAEMEPDLLYVCLLSEALKRKKDISGFEYLCIRDRFTDNDDDADTIDGIIIIDEYKEVTWLLNLVQQRFRQIGEWVFNMRDALVNNCDYQQLIDISEPILKNFVAILDSSYRLLAFSKNTLCREPINIALLEKGYHSDEVLNKFRDAKRFEIYEQEQGVVVSPVKGPISNYEILNGFCRYGGEWLLHVVMECSATPLSPGTVDLFEIFLDNLDICFARQQHTHPAQIYSSLIMEMLYGGLDDPFIIGERAKTADVPFYGHYNAYRIVFNDNSTVLIGRFVQELMTYLPKSRIVANNFEVSVLNIYNSPDVNKLSSINLDKLAPLFEKYGVLCGVSEIFTTLPEFKNACVQATRAQALGIQLRRLGNYWQLNSEIYKTIAVKGNGVVFHYNDIYVYLMLHLAHAGAFDVFKNTQYINTLNKLHEYDTENNTHLVQILYAHLVSERRATSTGRLLHMHRNNVLYHISRIEEITGINLDDYWVRIKLMLAFHFFELQESNKIFVNPGNNTSGV